MASELIDRLRKWVLAGASRPGLTTAELDSRFRYEDKLLQVEAPESAEWVDGHLEGFVDFTLVAEAVAQATFCMVIRGRDPVTDLWHQSAWVFEICQETVRRIVKTTSGQLRRRPYDGTLPLREVGG
jgi:hypothetical protein